jgi:hypothetical protein
MSGAKASRPGLDRIMADARRRIVAQSAGLAVFPTVFRLRFRACRDVGGSQSRTAVAKGRC